MKKRRNKEEATIQEDETRSSILGAKRRRGTQKNGRGMGSRHSLNPIYTSLWPTKKRREGGLGEGGKEEKPGE